MSVGILREGGDADEYRAACDADVSVGSSRRFGPDLLHDRQALAPHDRARRDVPAVVVKDPGHVLIAPIAEPLTLLEDDVSPVDELRRTAQPAATLRSGQDYTVDADRGVVRLTVEGRHRLHDAFGATDPSGMETPLLEKRLTEAVAAPGCYVQGRDYDLADRAVVPLASGTLPSAVRLRGGLLQAIETKEGVPVSDTQWITATVSVFEYFKRYVRVGGTSSADLMFTAELEELFGLKVQDRRGPEELRTQRQRAQQLAAYLALNRQIARWGRLGAPRRTELYDLRERIRQPLELRALLHQLVEAVVQEEIRRGGSGLRELQHTPAAKSSEFPLHRAPDAQNAEPTEGAVLRRARTICDDVLATEPDTQLRAIQSALDQAAVYQSQAEIYYRDRFWPEDLAAFEEEPAMVHAAVHTQFERAVAGHALHTG
ncbi:hypothetical protein [Streptomyces sp. NPDC086777]|uniref:hypothetical protein n=1 Tax=Streptomyces sp. NPDC086777 TaxID=3154866 RepID=UPI00344CD500